MRQITIKDVAREAGVSTSTVSRVLTESASVKEETRKKVELAIEKLKYSPNVIARSLRKKTSRTIGLIVPDISNPFFPDIAKGVEDRAREAGYNVILCNADDNPRKEVESIQLLKERQVDGVILVSSSTKGGHLQKFDSMKIVLVDRELEDMEADTVLCDNIVGSYLATKHLVELGHRDIAIVTGPMELNITRDRLLGYKKALNEKNLEVKDNWIWKAGFSFDRGYNVTVENIKKGNIPTAIFASSDIAAVGVIAALEQYGLKVPDDVSVVGFDDIFLSTLIKPTLTTIAQPTYQMGKKAAELLVGRGKNKRKKAKRIVLPTRLVVRNSSGPRSLYETTVSPK